MLPSDRNLRSLFACIVLLHCLIPSLANAIELDDAMSFNWIHMQGNLYAQSRLLDLSARRPSTILVENVGIVDLKNGKRF